MLWVDQYVAEKMQYDFLLTRNLRHHELPTVTVEGILMQLTFDYILFRQGDSWMVHIKSGVFPGSTVVITYNTDAQLIDRVQFVREAFGLSDEDVKGLIR